MPLSVQAMKAGSGAISPDGEWVAGAGWTAGWRETDGDSIYLFNRGSGKLMKRRVLLT